MQCHGGKASLLQISGQGVAFDLGAGKDDGLIDGWVAQPMVEHSALVHGVVGPIQLLRDIGVPLLRGVDIDLLGAVATAHHAQRELPHLWRESGREHQGLLALGAKLVDFGQVFGKTQVEHAVGFIQHQGLHGVQAQLAAAVQVQQAAGGGNHQIGVLQPCDLHAIGQAANDAGNAQIARVFDQRDGVLHHLLCQFACGAEHQRTGFGRFEVARIGRVFATLFFGWCLAARQRFSGQLFGLQACSFGRTGLLLQQLLQQGQQKGGGFATAGLAGHHQVVQRRMVVAVRTGQRLRNNPLLHGGGLGVAQIGYGLQQFAAQPQFGKGIGGRGCFGGRRGAKIWGVVGTRNAFIQRHTGFLEKTKITEGSKSYGRKQAIWRYRARRRHRQQLSVQRAGRRKHIHRLASQAATRVLCTYGESLEKWLPVSGARHEGHSHRVV